MLSLSFPVIARRLRRIAGVLRRHGLLRGFWWLRGPGGIDFSIDSASRWCAAYQDLGPTFVKFGQLLSLRGDLLPPEVTREFAKLQDRTTPLPAAVVRAEAEASLGGPLERFFCRFDEEPLAAASIAQVHGAALPDGREVIVKVQRPDIRMSIESDIAILQALAALVERLFPETRVHAPQAIVEEFRRSILKELDFRAEARAMERFGTHFAGDVDVCIPQVHHELSSARILVAERLDGRRITDVEGVPEAERVRLARALNNCYLTQIFEFGIFHADPHPGNIVVLPDGRICFHDFGIVGRLPTAHRRSLADLFRGIAAARRRPGARGLPAHRHGRRGDPARRPALGHRGAPRGVRRPAAEGLLRGGDARPRRAARARLPHPVPDELRALRQDDDDGRVADEDARPGLQRLRPHPGARGDARRRERPRLRGRGAPHRPELGGLPGGGPRRRSPRRPGRCARAPST